jgi:hypothetical protein
VNALNDSGLERITIISPCRRNETVRARYGILQPETVFSDEGVAHLAIALTNEHASVILSYNDGKTYSVTTDNSSLSAVLRITLQWDTPIDLDLMSLSRAAN